MKFTLSSLLLIAFFFTQAQTLQLSPSDTSTNNQMVTSSFDIVQMPAYLKNISGMDTMIMWEVESITAPSGWTTQFCDKYSCIDISQLNNSIYDLADNDSAEMKGQVIPECESGTGVLRIKMWIQGDASSAIIGTYVSQVTVDTSTCKVSTGIQSFFGDAGNLVVYPNPIQNDVFISLNSSSPSLMVNVFDLNGRMVIAEEMTNNSYLETASLPEGVYILKVREVDSGTLYTRKLLKQ